MEDLVRLYAFDVNFNLIILMLAFLVVSSFFSMSETVYSTVSPIRLKTNIEDGKRGSKKALWIVEQYDLTLTTILVGNNLANIALATVSVSFFTSFLPANIIGIMNTLVMTTIILIFGEILPKSIARNHADTISLRISSLFYYIKTNYFYFLGDQKQNN